MRTKTLLVAAAALAATVTASQAQTVYSQNVVGYINITVTNGTLAMCANQLDTGSNTLNNVFQGTAGAVSGKTQILEWNGAGYNTYFYENSSLSGSGTGWFDFSGNNVGITNMAQPGFGFFIKNAGAVNQTLSTVGQVIQGTNVYAVATGLNMYSVPEALAGLALDNTNINFPKVSGKIQYLTWTGSGFNTYFYENSSLSGAGTGFFDFSGNYIDNISSDWPPAGGGFFIKNTSGSTLYWTNTFQVQ